MHAYSVCQNNKNAEQIASVVFHLLQMFVCLFLLDQCSWFGNGQTISFSPDSVKMCSIDLVEQLKYGNTKEHN